ncbi:hypothetical protein HK100_000208 [Physocladia obscura]|uniref:F-box domain-containing protein n=1 Tax=Physocladia obscura TaxID=109957 RepID=A0AAD5SYR6_9FUNG|nr:hypothetical protein HK100_000208 [Physocladia obscura]
MITAPFDANTALTTGPLNAINTITPANIKNSSNKPGIIIGIVCGIVALAAIGATAWYYTVQKGNSKTNTARDATVAQQFGEPLFLASPESLLSITKSEAQLIPTVTQNSDLMFPPKYESESAVANNAIYSKNSLFSQEISVNVVLASKIQLYAGLDENFVCGWSAKDVGIRLAERTGVKTIKQKVIENNVDGKALILLAGADLGQLGVVRLGDRVKILSAIKNMIDYVICGTFWSTWQLWGKSDKNIIKMSIRMSNENMRLPREIWVQIFEWCRAADIGRLQCACIDFREIGNSSNSRLWKRKAADILMCFAISPTSNVRATALNLRLLIGETYRDLVCIWESWNHSLRVKRLTDFAQQSAKQMDPELLKSSYSLPVLSSPKSLRRIIAAEPVSHSFIVRWSCHGPIAYFHKELILKMVFLATSSSVTIDSRFKHFRFAYTIPHSNWVVFTDNFGEFQLGWFDVEHMALAFVDSTSLKVAVSQALVNITQILPLRGYANILVVSACPVENDGSTTISLIGIKLSRNAAKNVVDAQKLWTQTVVASSIFADSHDAFMLFRKKSAFEDFCIVSIRCGSILAGGTQRIESSAAYQEIAQDAVFLTCSRMHFLATREGCLNACTHDSQKILSTVLNEEKSMTTRSVIGDDSSTVIAIHTRSERNKAGEMKTACFLNFVDVRSGEWGKKMFAQAGGVPVSGVWIIYEDYFDHSWHRNILFVDVAKPK